MPSAREQRVDDRDERGGVFDGFHSPDIVPMFHKGSRADGLGTTA